MRKPNRRLALPASRRPAALRGDTYPECRSRHDEEVHGGKIGDVVLEESAPGLRGWLRPAPSTMVIYERFFAAGYAMECC